MKFEVEVWFDVRDNTSRFKSEFNCYGMVGISGFHNNPLDAMEEARQNWCKMDSMNKAKEIIAKAKSNA